MTIEFSNQSIVITGGASGIGLALAQQFGREGARVLIADLEQGKVGDAVQQLRDAGGDAHGTTCDVADRSQVEQLAEHAWQLFGSVDAIVNNAGIGSVRSAVIDARREDIDRVLDVNLFGVWNGVSVFGRRLIEQGTPCGIYNVGSENSFFNAVPNTASYVVSKHGVFALTEALREEVPEFVRVGLIVPGFVNTALIPDGMRFGMDAARFAEIVLEQLKAGEFYIVSHAYNVVRMKERFGEIHAAYERSAPRYDGDDEYDVRTLIGRLAAQAAGDS